MEYEKIYGTYLVYLGCLFIANKCFEYNNIEPNLAYKLIFIFSVLCWPIVTVAIIWN